MAYDLVIENGRIVDGSGRAEFPGGVAVNDGKIVEVGEVSGAAKRRIDAKGLVIAPGIVDIHTHYDAQVLWDPLLTSSVWHGVTTVVMGNCGFTIAPCKPDDQDYIMRMLARVEGMSLGAMRQGPEWDWRTFEEYMERVGQTLGLNAACQVGHSALRYSVMGPEALEREATPDEVEAMCGLLRDALAVGAVGFTTSISRAHVDWEGNPVPSRFAAVSEIDALVAMVGERGFGQIEIAPRSGTNLPDDDQEDIARWARTSGRVLSWNELGQYPQAPEGRWREILDFMERTHREGGRVYGVCSCRPTTQDFDLKDNNLVLTVLPEWLAVLPKPDAEKKALLADPAYRDGMKPGIDAAWESGPKPVRWDSTMLTGPKRPEHADLKGLTLREIGRRMDKHPLDAMIEIALAEDLVTEFTFSGTRNTDPEAIASIIRSPYTILGVSDAGAHLNMIAGAEYSTQVLSQWVRDKGVLTLEEGVHKLTGMPAGYMGFTDRGRLEPGLAADIMVFDPDTIGALPKEKVPDLPNGEERIVIKAKGIEHTIVNGIPVVEAAEHTGAYPGRLIRSTDYA